MWWQTLLGVVGGILLIYLTLLAMLWRYSRSHPEAVGMREALRLLPDLLRLLRRLVADPTLPLRVRVQLGLLMAYLVSPIDLIPDFIPILGYLDDLILVPLGIALAVKMIPETVLVECRAKAQAAFERPTNRKAAAVIIAIWLAFAVALIWLAYEAVT